MKLWDFLEPETKSMALIKKIQEVWCHLVSDPPAHEGGLMWLAGTVGTCSKRNSQFLSQIT